MRGKHILNILQRSSGDWLGEHEETLSLPKVQKKFVPLEVCVQPGDLKQGWLEVSVNSIRSPPRPLSN